MDCSVALRIKLVEPPDGFAFCLQKGKGAKSERLAYAIAEGKGLTFELDVDVRKSNKSAVSCQMRHQAFEPHLRRRTSWSPHD